MGIPGSANLLLAAAEAESYQIEQSLRFREAQYLQRTISSASSSTWTLSFWLKQTKPQNISSGGDSYFWDADGTALYVNNNSSAGSDRYKIVDTNASSTRKAAGMTRDPNAWYHLVYWCDGSNNRLYVNGSLTSGWSVSGSSTHNGTNAIGRYRYNSASSGATYLNGYLAELHFVDGTALVPDGNFGEYDNNGVWRPIEYTGSHGTQGCYLKFDPDATNGIGHDHSANSNNFTATGFTTSGIGTDVMSDTPTTNFPTLNPLDNLNGRFSNPPTNGNLEVSIPSDSVSKRNFPGLYSTQAIPTTGKFYFEFEPSQQYTEISIVDVDEVNTISSGDDIGASDKLSFKYATDSGDYRFNGSTTASGLGGFSSGNIYGVAVDLQNETFRVYENGVAGSELSVSGYLGANARVAPSINSSGASGTVKMNFGQREFAYPPGTASATNYFNTVTYSGTGATQSITGVGFQPDFVFIKHRNGTGNYNLFDSVRGVGKQLYSNLTNEEGDFATSGLTAFGTDGFTLGNSANSDANINSNTYVAWCWKAGGTGSANNSGSLDATVSASQDAGFSVVTYTGNSVSGATFAHGLSVAPTFVAVKNRDSASQGWMIFHASLGNTKAIQFTSSSFLTDTAYWNDTTPSSTLVTLGNDNATNASGDDFVAYCWTDKTGVTKTGTYAGNGSDPGNISVDCGFKPAMVMVKGDASASWQIIDSARGDDNALFPDSNSAENSRADRKILFTQSGFIVQGNDGNINSNGVNYYFIAFAQNFSADTDFKALNTKNTPAPDIANGSAYFNTVTYTGNGSTQSITGVGFQPDWTWIKIRSQAGDHVLQDAVRGTFRYLLSNATQAENTSSTLDFFRSFDSDGFSVAYTATNGANYNETNLNSATYVAWNWLAGGSGSSNTAGTITSTVSASPSSGFSIATYTGTGANASFGHGLGVVPAMCIIKSRDASQSWWVWHKSFGNNDGANNSMIELNSNGTKYASDDVFRGFTSTVVKIGTDTGSNTSGDDYVAYTFAEVEGYSRVGSYTGNGSTDGVYIHLGFRPSWVLTKRTDSTGEWYVTDATRSAYNLQLATLFPNLNNAETTDGGLDLLANGFKLRNIDGSDNDSGGTYIFIAFAENPFGGDGVSPATAR